MSKHTPGPWLTKWQRGHRVFVEHEDGDEVIRDLIARVSGPEANTRLIAAAPEMIEAIKKVVGVYLDDDESGRLGRPVLNPESPMYARRCLEALLKSGGKP